ncbi:hypothetical protein J8L98_07125 [Pseudoalteromonas sp. MMG013]|uniref:Response regulatory domain-containing protein n=1 Tax=Pseudoalteromonas aurantia 208 TaxID=1314867 RepID=A0ABR9E780_9GAMM|nr:MULTISPECIES: hypothetical protein [Pseudoalteromonas]MBE0366853.1 hypothetical protein [Pseudoalteromonas aurantia 208]MBQ4847033.1 hypothetical protein [Pseudoalteromonas sp. MMG005]MBQ4849597.1 hypothetical protein [Pseudoalteromonas sp. MMG012]MBQ4861461.1 hypothetical protein [Pseudoalteromonas sp. MMG013]
MPINLDNFLLVDSNSEFSRELAEHLKANDQAENLIVAGDNTRHLVKMMFDNLISDYCYCDFANEISVSELATYLHDHHKIQGVLISSLDYKLANEAQLFILDSLHPKRYLVEQLTDGYQYQLISSNSHNNHLSCQFSESEDIT